MIHLDSTNAVSIQTLTEALTNVENGSHYLRVKCEGGQLYYDTVAKETGFFGRIAQFVTRLFDSSYNLNKSSALLFRTLADMPEAGEAKEKLVNVVTHVNTKRFFRKIDLPQWAQTAAKTAAVVTEGRPVKDPLDAWADEGDRRDESRWIAVDRIRACIYYEKTELDLSNLSLSSLPPGIDKLTFLKNLNLTGNKLTSLPKEIGRLTSLEGLFLGANKLKSLEEASPLTSLKHIDLTRNPLTSIPAALCKLPSLEQIYMDRAHRELLPPDMHQDKVSLE